MNVRTARLTTLTLAGTCGVLLLVAIAQYAGLGRGHHWSDDGDGTAGRTPVGTVDKQQVQMPPFSSFAAIEAHPLFNEDREPTPIDASGSDEGTPPPSPLNVALTGVILDEKNHVSIAMLQDKARNESIALKVGMPLEGDQASWTLVDVKPRAVVFRNSANETSEIELETAIAQPAAPKRPVRGGAKPANAANNTAKKTASGSSEDLAQRIEERRRQMREDAERLRKGQKPAPRPPKK